MNRLKSMCVYVCVWVCVCVCVYTHKDKVIRLQIYIRSAKCILIITIKIKSKLSFVIPSLHLRSLLLDATMGSFLQLSRINTQAMFYAYVWLD